jgi:outer membrane receptor for ferrienterochelin and colicins
MRLGMLCITLARLWWRGSGWAARRVLQPIAQLLARKSTPQIARARAATVRKELCRASLALWPMCLALWCCPALAHDAHFSKGSERLDQPWDFTLPTLDGSRFVQASALKGPVLVNFWGRDCAPCITELPRLQAFANTNPQWRVLLVSTDTPADASAFVQRHGVQLMVLRPGTNVGALMRSAGNHSGGLPFTVALRSDGQEARLCNTHLGELTQTDLARLAATCTPQGQP